MSQFQTIATRALGVLLLAFQAFAQQPLHVVVTTPDLGSLVREVGGGQVTVTELVKGREDPHYAEPKPSFVKALSTADLYIQVGMDLEAGYAALLLQNARNANVLPGNVGYLDASQVVQPLEVPSAPVDRSMGDVHPFGNPHYLLDPLNGLRVAELIQQRLAQLRPAQADLFAQRLHDFRGRTCSALVGQKLAAEYDCMKLALLYEAGGLEQFLDSQGRVNLLHGWLGMMQPHRGRRVVDDHPMWSYFARRFGLVIAGHMEPKPGIPPTTRHLRSLVETMRAHKVDVVIAAPYYDPRHADLLARATGARIAPLAHQTGARPGTSEYLAMIDYNVRTVEKALRGFR